MRHLELFEDVPNDRIDEVIRLYVKGERNREIMHDRLVEYLTFERIAEKYELSPRYVQSLIYKLEETVFRHL